MSRAAEQVLSTRALNRALLARQLLLERSNLGIAEALEAVGGLQTQYAPSGYIGVWSRLADFRRDALTEALMDRSVVQATLMRSTIHMVSARDYWPLSEGTRSGRREQWTRALRGALDEIGLDRPPARVRELLAAGPRRHGELLDVMTREGFPRIALVLAVQLGDLVRVPPSGTWERRRADLYGLADDWLGRSTAGDVDGLEHVFRRYLGGFGPAALNDIASWAGLPPAALKPIADRIELRRFRDEAGKELLDLPGAPLPDPEMPAPVRFLPTWDATLLVHARRTQILPEPYRPLVFNTKTPHSVPTVLVDGQVAAKWRYEKGEVVVEPFGLMTNAVRREVDEEAERMAAFHSGSPDRAT